MKRRWFLGSVVALATLVACEKVSEPNEPVWGKQPCAHCAMVISDKRHAAQIVSADERKYFDDIGCMIGWIHERKVEPQKSWVRDTTSDKWVEATRARYVAGAHTPMDFGFEATMDKGISYDEMRAAVLAKMQVGP
ncbi:MAG: nitrous oxide reductase accessory protein NosL [Polyangiaceae bacterium]|nr:nitrous oxide reductase accessory protein NosL [Polyangiaceae bacterium]